MGWLCTLVAPDARTLFVVVGRKDVVFRGDRSSQTAVELVRGNFFRGWVFPAWHNSLRYVLVGYPIEWVADRLVADGDWCRRFLANR